MRVVRSLAMWSLLLSSVSIIPLVQHVQNVIIHAHAEECPMTSISYSSSDGKPTRRGSTPESRNFKFSMTVKRGNST